MIGFFSYSHANFERYVRNIHVNQLQVKLISFIAYIKFGDLHVFRAKIDSYAPQPACWGLRALNATFVSVTFVSRWGSCSSPWYK